MLTSLSSREQSVKSAHISTLWSGRVDCSHIRQEQHQPRTSVPPVLLKDHSLLGQEELHCPGGAHAPRQLPSDDVFTWGHRVSNGHLVGAATGLLGARRNRTNRCSQGSYQSLVFPVLSAFALNYMFKSSNSLVCEIDTSGHIHSRASCAV